MKIIVYIQSIDGKINNNSLEAFVATKKIKDSKVYFLTFDKEVADKLKGYNSSGVILVNNKELKSYNPIYYLKTLEETYKKYNPDFILANGENASHGKGISKSICDGFCPEKRPTINSE